MSNKQHGDKPSAVDLAIRYGEAPDGFYRGPVLLSVEDLAAIGRALIRLRASQLMPGSDLEAFVRALVDLEVAVSLTVRWILRGCIEGERATVCDRMRAAIAAHDSAIGKAWKLLAVVDGAYFGRELQK